jgi:hypothetical protein
MEEKCCGSAAADSANAGFESIVLRFLREWVKGHGEFLLLRFDQSLEEYLAGDALRDFFLTTSRPLQELLKDEQIARHLGRDVSLVYFDPVSGDPLFAKAEQRIYNLARRMDSERMHVPFRSVHPLKQTTFGDLADIASYPPNAEEVRYNSGNHFASCPANTNVFEQNSRFCEHKSLGNVHVLLRRGFLEERLADVKLMTAALGADGASALQFFIICSRHSEQEGHFGTSLLVMDPAHPDFPLRVLVCDTLLKELPHHPRWWNHFVSEYSNVFGDGVVELIEDLSHPLQKVNIKGDDPFNHDWDCPYYAASMTSALADLVLQDPLLFLNASVLEVHEAMKRVMPDYYHPNLELKNRVEIRMVNRLKRWESGKMLIGELVVESVGVALSQANPSI